ncbi:MATE family efflux transporter [Oceanimonas sp. CHS3-5]|uniref:MATE family efflux transporter n=1 Tax=Oceanimonas sp. CHS3-5 TaxID=3068186 RepID=UPI00273FAE3D|nr:MATE family efflux transporter [Oceanimonas sp. CHS3-5]MDP5291796.1 MATE family efflux transporter [Oceanimonas sp. CHS3-5]
MSVVERGHPMVQTPVLPLFFRFAGQALISLLAITSASLVDGLFVGNLVGADALAAVTLLVPYFTLLFALALVLAIGGSVRAGHHLGAGNAMAAGRLFGAALLTIALLAMLAGVAATLWPHLLFDALGAPARLRPLMAEYLGIMNMALVIQLVTMVAYYFIRSDGHPELATRALIGGALCNMLLNGLLVGVLELGLAGAAWATLLAQLIQILLLGRYFQRPERTLRLRLNGYPWRDMAAVWRNGLSEGVNEISVGVVIWLINWLMLDAVGPDGVAAFSIVNYLIFTGVMICYGIVDGVHPLVSHNQGAGRPDRVRQVVKMAALTLAAIAVLMTSLLLLAGSRIPALFLDTDEQHTLILASHYLAIIWPLFLFNGFNMLIAVTFTALQRPLPSALIAFSRGLILPVGLMLWLANRFADTSFLLALPLAEGLTLALALLLVLKTPITTKPPCQHTGGTEH